MAAPAVVAPAPATASTDVTAPTTASPPEAPKPSLLAGAYGAYLSARFAAGHGDFSLALADFQRSGPMDGSNSPIAQQAFLAAIMSDSPDAIPLARMLGAQPGQLEPVNQVLQPLVLGNAEALAGHWDAAEQRFLHLPRQPVAQILQPLLLAWAQQGAGRTDDALATLSAALRMPRASSILALHAAMIADLAGRTSDADRFYAMAQGSAPALSLREAQILSSWQARQGRRGVAEATLQTVGNAGAELALAVPGLQRDAAARAIARPIDGMAEAYLALAGALRQQGQTDYALLLLHLTLDLRPNFTPARLLMADALAQIGDNATAIATLDAVPASDPLAPVAAFHRALLTAAIGKPDDAARMLQDLAKAFPDRPEPLQALGDMQRQDHRWPEAITAYTDALARIQNPGPQSWGIYFNRGSVYDRAHDWPKAQADLEHALELQPNQAAVLNYLGYAWADQGHELDRARTMLEKAVSLRPSDGNIIDSLGWVLLRQGDSAGALRELERAAEMEPEDSTINGHLGDAYWAVGRRLEAQYQWRRALDLTPEPEDVPKLQAKLRDAASPALARQGPDSPAMPGASQNTVQ